MKTLNKNNRIHRLDTKNSTFTYQYALCNHQIMNDYNKGVNDYDITRRESRVTCVMCLKLIRARTCK